MASASLAYSIGSRGRTTREHRRTQQQRRRAGQVQLVGGEAQAADLPARQPQVTSQVAGDAGPAFGAG